MTHAIVPLAVAGAFGKVRIAVPVSIAGAVLAMLPDADVLGFSLGIEYAADWGHRGASHSLLFAVIFGGLVTAMFRPQNWRAVFLFLSASCASHGLLDMATSGGLGVGLYWPLETDRHFFDYRPIRVSPIGRSFFTERGVATMQSELKWVWLPAITIMGLGWSIRHFFAAKSTSHMES